MSLRKHTAMNLVGAFAPMLVSLVTVPAYLRLIGPERYGALAILWVLLGYFGFFDLGFGRAIAQRMARFESAPREERSRLAWTALAATCGLSFIGSLLLWITSDWLMTSVFKISEANHIEASSGVHWLLVLLPIALINSVLIGALQARLQFFTLNLAQFIGTTLGQLLPLLAAAAGYVGLDSLIPAVVAARLTTLIFVGLSAKRQVPIIGRPVIDADHLRQLLKYGGWVSVTAVLGPLLVTFDRLILAALAGTKAVTFYTVPYDLAIKAIIVAGSVANALTPRLAAASEPEARRLAGRVTTLMAATMTPLIIVAVFVAHPVIKLWVGATMATASQSVAELIFIGIWLHAIMTPHHSRLMAQDAPRKVVVIYLLEIPVYFAALYFGAKNLGVSGAAAAWTFRVALDAVLILYAAGALAEVLRETWASLMVIAATLTTHLLLDSNGHTRYLFGAALLLVSMLINRTHILDGWTQLRLRVSERLSPP